MKLADALQSCSLGLLREIAAQHGMTAGPDVLRNELVQRLQQELATNEALDRIATEFPLPAWELLGALLSAGGCLPGARVRRWWRVSHGAAAEEVDDLI